MILLLVVSLNFMFLAIGFLIVAYVCYKIGQRVKNWRSTIAKQHLLLEEKEKEITELKDLWKVNPSFIEWQQLLSRCDTS